MIKLKRYSQIITGIIYMTPLTDICCYAGEDTAPETLFAKISNMLHSGGGLMWVMLFTSIIGLTYAIERLISLRINNYIRISFKEELESKLKADSLTEAMTFLTEDNTLIAKAFKGIITRSSGTREEIERGIDDDLSRALWDERKNIKPLGLVASIAPLLGLLGTVVGMIDAFKQASENGMNDPAIFAGGIYQALYTTAFGLVLAIPFFILYNYLKSKSELIIRKVEDESLLFVDKVIEIRDCNIKEDKSIAA